MSLGAFFFSEPRYGSCRPGSCRCLWVTGALHYEVHDRRSEPNGTLLPLRRHFHFPTRIPILKAHSYKLLSRTSSTSTQSGSQRTLLCFISRNLVAVASFVLRDRSGESPSRRACIVSCVREEELLWHPVQSRDWLQRPLIS
jgi:hypothetical protein